MLGKSGQVAAANANANKGQSSEDGEDEKMADGGEGGADSDGFLSSSDDEDDS